MVWDQKYTHGRHEQCGRRPSGQTITDSGGGFRSVQDETVQRDNNRDHQDTEVVNEEVIAHKQAGSDRNDEHVYRPLKRNRPGNPQQYENGSDNGENLNPEGWQSSPKHAEKQTA